MPERVIAYVDGLNVYEGLRAKGWRDLLWLDFRALIAAILRSDQTLEEVFYFTAHRRSPPESYARQVRYFEALDELGGVTRVEGSFERQKAPCSHCGLMTEIPRERQTDVNMASQLVHDAHNGRMELALIITGDSDYLRPISLVQTAGVRVKLASIPGRRSDQLDSAVDYHVHLRRPQFQAARLANPVQRKKGAAMACPYPWLTVEEKVELCPAPIQRQFEAIRQSGNLSRSLLHRVVDELSRDQSAILRG